MTTFAIKILLNFLTVDNLCAVLAKTISMILSYASKKGGKAWDVAKGVIVKVNNWTSLFLQVYEDETLDKDEEKLIAESIKNETDIAKVVDILKKAASEKKAVGAEADKAGTALTASAAATRKTTKKRRRQKRGDR